ncbi:PepSY-associated TM helix domain-containing protein [Ulvibacterium marinum]|uniref:PepSY-associated TM helix domain-containing protein n=1 Tax=Ulvibacterium marinum TaxID=2419782 RepID=UPI002494F603|nr:PepSY-associated TM helix domain-containing protein [Ulvibacterium marinum]
MSQRKSRSTKKNLLWRIHSWVGLYAGVVIAFLSLTGAAALFRMEIDEALNPSLYVAEKESTKMALNDIAAAVTKAHPDKELFEVYIPTEATGTYNLRLMAKSAPRIFPVFWEVFVNPYTGEILGERNYYKTFNYYLRNIHVRFYEAFWGRQIVGLAGLALLISTITGFLIYGRFMKKQSLGQIRSKNLRMRQADLHKFIGVLALAFNLMIAITGTWLGLQNQLQKAFSIERPNMYKRIEKPLTPKEDLAMTVNFDQALKKSSSIFPQLIPKTVRPSRDGARTIEIVGDVPGQAYERVSNKLVLDKGDLSTLLKYNISEDNFGGKLFFVQESFHFGDFAGIWLKVLYAFLALTSGFLALSGFIIYLKRTEKKRTEKPSFVELRPLLYRWVFGIITFCMAVGVMSVIWGIGVPSVMVIILFYGLLTFLLLKALFLWLRSRLFKKPLQT